MKAQSFFGGTKPKDQASKVRQFGNSSAGTGVNTGQASRDKTAKRTELGVPHGTITRRTKVRQYGNSGRAKQC